MLQQVGLVSCDLIGHSSERDQAVQRQRVLALNGLVRRAIAHHGPDKVIWNGEGDGGHVAFLLPDWPAAALSLLLELADWSLKASAPLRLCGHCGEVEQIEGADGRALLVGPGINLAGRLLEYGDANRIVVSDPFRQAVVKAALPGIELHGETTVWPRYFLPQTVCLLSAQGRRSSTWDSSRPDDRQLLTDAAGRQPSWDAIYYAKRLLQSNAEDAEALRGLMSLEELGLTYLHRSGKARINPMIGLMDRTSRLELVRAAQLVEREVGDVLSRAGDPGETMFLVLRGAVGVFPPGVPGPTVVMGPGEIVGELAYALRRPRTATLQCLNRTALLAFNYQQSAPLLRASRFSARARETMDRFLVGRALRYLCDNAPCFVGKDRSGPLASREAPWEAMVDSGLIIDCPARTDKGAPTTLSRETAGLGEPGLYFLVSGKVSDRAARDRMRSGDDLLLVYADLPGEELDAGRQYGVEEDAKLLRVSWEAFAYEPAVMHRVADAVRAMLAPPAPTAETAEAGTVSFSGLEAFSAQSVLIHYPAPIAFAYRRFCQAREPAARLDRLFKALEATIKYLAFVGLADLLWLGARQGGTGPVVPEAPAFDCLRRPTKMTLGKWVALLRGVAAALGRERDRFVKELPEVCRPGDYLDTYLLEWIVASRNVAEHVEGSLALDEAEVSRLVGEVRPRLEDALSKVGFLRNYPLGFASQGVSSSAGQGARRYYLHSCMGARIAASDEAYAIDLAIDLPTGAPFISAPEGSRLLYLWPWALEREVEQTGRSSLFVFETIAARHTFLTKVRMAAIDARVSVDAPLHSGPAADLGWLLQRLRELPALVELPRGLGIASGLLPARHGELIGKEVGGNQLLAVIAAGGFGTVYAAQAKDGSRVAVKVLELALQRDRARQYPRFRQEFDKLKAVGDHPGIIRCYDSGVELIGGREYPWYSMELAVGDLNAHIHERLAEARDRLPWAIPAFRAQIVHEIQEITQAVAHLHGRGIVHRDIKPGNVLIAEDGSLRLADFGLVKMLDVLHEGEAAPHTSTGARLGTEHYMAPEQAAGAEVDERADVYALGIVLAELAVGRRPNPDLRVGEGSTLKNCRLVQRLARELRKFIYQCTDAAPEQRPADAATVEAQLAALCTDNA